MKYDYIVDSSGKGTHITIQAAIDATEKSDAAVPSILIRPGFYDESLVAHEPLELKGGEPTAD